MEQVDLAHHQIQLEGDQSKNAELRILQLPSELVAMLEKVQKPEGLVFDDDSLVSREVVESVSRLFKTR